MHGQKGMKGIFWKLRMVYTMTMIRSKANPTHTKINISTTEPESLVPPRNQDLWVQRER